MFSKSCEYALRSVLYLATHTDRDRKIGADELSIRLDAPRHFLAKILQQLAKNRLISSVRGPKGGFYLGSANLDVDLLSVIECMDGPDFFETCMLGLPECTDINPCPLHEGMVACREKMLATLKQQTIQNTAERIRKDNLKI